MSIPYWRIGEGRVRSEGETRERRRAAFNLWRKCEYLSPDCIAANYFRGRGIGYLVDRKFRDAIRWLPEAHHRNGGKYPAIVAQVWDGRGNLCAVHRTYLQPDGSGKIQPTKDATGSYGPIAGGAIRLWPLERVLEAGALVVGEGLETVASAAALVRLPAWSSIAAGNLGASMILPGSIRHVMIAVDRDEAGEEAARLAADRWQAEGRTVDLLQPDRAGDDFNDVLRRWRADNGC